MSIDTAIKRKAAFSFGYPIPLAFPDADGTIDAFDQALLLDSYLVTALPETRSVRTRIRLAIFIGLAEITKANGYFFTVGDTPKNEKSFEQMINLPAVNVVFGTEIYDPLGHTFGYLHKRLPVSFQCYVKDVNNVKLGLMKMLSDIEKYFMSNRELPDADGNPSFCGDLMAARNQAFGMYSNKPKGIVSIDLQIDYLTNVLDPKLSTMATTVPSFDSDPPATIATSKRDVLRQALKTNLEKIATASGYNFNVGEVNRNEKSPEQLKNLPAINITNPTETIENVNNHGINDSQLHKELSIPLEAYVKDVNDSLLEKENILADMEAVLMNNFTLPDGDGKKTCVQASLLSNQFMGMWVNQRLKPMVRLNVICRYRQSITNPAEITT